MPAAAENIAGGVTEITQFCTSMALPSLEHTLDVVITMVDGPVIEVEVGDFIYRLTCLTGTSPALGKIPPTCIDVAFRQYSQILE